MMMANADGKVQKYLSGKNACSKPIYCSKDGAEKEKLIWKSTLY